MLSHKSTLDFKHKKINRQQMYFCFSIWSFRKYYFEMEKQGFSSKCFEYTSKHQIRVNRHRSCTSSKHSQAYLFATGWNMICFLKQFSFSSCQSSIGIKTPVMFSLLSCLNCKVIIFYLLKSCFVLKLGIKVFIMYKKRFWYCYIFQTY